MSCNETKVRVVIDDLDARAKRAQKRADHLIDEGFAQHSPEVGIHTQRVEIYGNYASRLREALA